MTPLFASLHDAVAGLIHDGDTVPLSIGDGELAETADTVISIPEIFAYWLQAGRIDVGFLGAAQTEPGTAEELGVLRDLEERSARAHHARRGEHE